MIMATTGMTVTPEARNVVDVLSLPAGSYRIQNVGNQQIFYAESPADPGVSGSWHFMDPGDYENITASTEGWWFKTLFSKSSKLSVTPFA